MTPPPPLTTTTNSSADTSSSSSATSTGCDGSSVGVLAPFSGQAARDYDERSKIRLKPMKDALHCQLKYAFANRLSSHVNKTTKNNNDDHNDDTDCNPGISTNTTGSTPTKSADTDVVTPSPPPHILCVGVGTGEELFYLAKEFPFCHFTALDISNDMIQQCRIKATQLATNQDNNGDCNCGNEYEGLLERIHFHTGTVASLPETTATTSSTSTSTSTTTMSPIRYDGATSILVSQYITNRPEREVFFWEISKRLKAGAVLFHVDLALDQTLQSNTNQELLWQSWIASNAVPPQNIDRLRSAMNDKTKIALSDPKDIEQMICHYDGGFHHPVQTFQWILAHGWICEAK